MFFFCKTSETREQPKTRRKMIFLGGLFNPFISKIDGHYSKTTGYRSKTIIPLESGENFLQNVTTLSSIAIKLTSAVFSTNS